MLVKLSFSFPSIPSVPPCRSSPRAPRDTNLLPSQADVSQEVKNGQILSGVWRGHLSHAVPSLPQEVTQICTVATALPDSLDFR